MVVPVVGSIYTRFDAAITTRIINRVKIGGVIYFVDTWSNVYNEEGKFCGTASEIVVPQPKFGLRQKLNLQIGNEYLTEYGNKCILQSFVDYIDGVGDRIFLDFDGQLHRDNGNNLTFVRSLSKEEFDALFHPEIPHGLIADPCEDPRKKKEIKRPPPSRMGVMFPSFRMLFSNMAIPEFYTPQLLTHTGVIEEKFIDYDAINEQKKAEKKAKKKAKKEGK